MIKNNYHTHMKYCNHAVGDVIDYVKAAYLAGFGELGMTDHAPILDSFMTKEEYEANWCEENMKLDTFEIYLEDIRKAQAEYAGKIKIYSGLESEYLQGKEEFYKMLRSKVDYLNLGVHYFYDEKGHVINTYSQVDYKNLKYYVKACIDGMATGLFNTLVHPDLFMFGYKNKNGERKFDEEAIKATHEICKAALKYNIYLEVNANGLKNSKIWGDGSWLYPYYEFWDIAVSYPGLKVLIGADAHDPAHLNNESVEAVCKFASEHKIPIEEKMEINH